MDTLEYLLQKLIKGEKITEWESFNRLESYLIACINKEGIEELGIPQNRLEILLNLLYEQMRKQGTGEEGITPSGTKFINTTNKIDVYSYEYAQVEETNLIADNIKEGISILGVVGTHKGGTDGVPVQVSTSEEMESLLTAENEGKVFIYTGVSNETFTNGEIYQIIEEV